MALSDGAARKLARDILLANERRRAGIAEQTRLKSMADAESLTSHAAVSGGVEGVTAAELGAVITGFGTDQTHYTANLETAAAQASAGFKAQ